MTTASTPGSLQSRASVDLLDSRVRMRAAYDAAVCHVGQGKISRIDRLAGDLVGSVVPHWALAQDGILTLSEKRRQFF